MSELITFEPVGHATLGTLSVRRPSESDVEELARAFRGLLDVPGPRLVVLDFSGVESFEANLRGKLIWLYKRLTDGGGRLALCCLGLMASHPTMIEFARLMPICDTREESLRALGRTPGSAGADHDGGRPPSVKLPD